jgi:hypothetical protein
LETPAAAWDELAAAPPPVAAAALSGLAERVGPAAVPVLGLVAERAGGEVGTAAIAALGALPDGSAATTLARLAETATDKEQRKAARRALFRLRGRGIAVPAEPEAARPAATPMQPRATLYRALATNSDGVGSRALWLFAERPLGGVYLLAFVLNDVVGMKDAYTRDSTRKKLAAREAEMREQEGMTWIELPIPYAQWLIQEAVALNAESGFPVPTDYRLWREVIGEPAQTFERPLAYEEVSRFEVKMRPELARESPRLFEEPELAGWLLGFKDVQPYATELRRARESRLVLSAESEEQRAERVRGQAIRDLFTPAQRRALQRRLEETAYLFLRTERPQPAKLAVAAAVELADTDPVLLSRHPFVQALVDRSIELAIRAERAGIDPRDLDRSAHDPLD